MARAVQVLYVPCRGGGSPACPAPPCPAPPCPAGFPGAGLLMRGKPGGSRRYNNASNSWQKDGISAFVQLAETQIFALIRLGEGRLFRPLPTGEGRALTRRAGPLRGPSPQQPGRFPGPGVSQPRCCVPREPFDSWLP